MKIENAHTSLELSKRLRELGVKQASHFSYVNRSSGGELVLLTESPPPGHMLPENYAAAFSVAEIFQALSHTGAWIEERLIDHYAAGSDLCKELFDERPVEAIGLVLEYLIKEGIVSVDEVNKRILSC